MLKTLCKPPDKSNRHVRDKGQAFLVFSAPLIPLSQKQPLNYFGSQVTGKSHLPLTPALPSAADVVPAAAMERLAVAG
ncbi:hypothetical protein V6N13_083322 [Hibiscus sabdariffa]